MTMKATDYSTTRRLTNEKPACFDTLMSELPTLLKIPDSDSKIAEGGLRLQGQFKSNSDDKPLITVVTVVYNSAKLLEDTIQSVIEQSYDNVEYIVVDGGSTDGSVEVIRKYEHAIDYWVSEPDKGMYDGMSKGFQTASGKIMCYLNAGDLYVKSSLDAVAAIFKNTGSEWITGIRSVCNEENQVIKVDTPFRYKSRLIQKGVYGKYLPYIQQESTFWLRSLVHQVDVDIFKSLRYSGDYYLWFCFSKVAQLRVAEVQLGVFKKHEGQLSESLDKYWSEVHGFVQKITFIDLLLIVFEAPFWLLDNRFRRLSQSANIAFLKNGWS